MKMKKRVWLVTAVFVAIYVYMLNAGSSGSKDMKMNRKATLNISEGEWKAKLTSEQYRILRQMGTEMPFTGKYYDSKDKGEYVCAGCGAKLFLSGDKFDSGCGWPSFSAPAGTNVVDEYPDKSLGVSRTEVTCSKCGGHLGHVFGDGPQPTGLRYCINSEALGFKKADAFSAGSTNMAVVTLGAGCFWCTEAAYGMIDGVIDVKVGYMGGQTKNPTYKQVCKGDTGHAEVAQIKYDPLKTSLDKILDVFWIIHDPTTLNRQGGDTGTQYRSVVFYHNEEQKADAEKSLANHQKKSAGRIVTEIVPASEFYIAEDYHQEYYKNNSDAPYCRAVINPKLEKVKKLKK